MRTWSPNSQRQYAILFLILLTFVFPVALHATARTLNAVTVAGTTVIGNGTQAVSTSSAVAAPVINFADGFADSQRKVKLKGDAQLSGSAIQLTAANSHEASATWYSTPLNVQSFTTDFTFQLTDASADGFTFAIQNNNNTVVGGSGGGLGYASIPNSVAVKFDLHSNEGEGPDSTGLYENGAQPMMPAVDMTSSGVNLHSGHTMAVRLVYNGTRLMMTITDTVTKASFSTNWTINIPATIGADNAYVGFTGGTGRLTAIQKILSWTYSTGAVLPAPVFNLAGGRYSSAQTVTISDATPGTTIYYTTDGSAPSTSSAVYSRPIKVSSNKTLKAMAVGSGYTNSPAATAAYIFDNATPGATPAINFPSGFASSRDQFTILGSAQLSRSAIELTDGGEYEAGAAWYATPVNVQSFTSNFTFQLTNPSADGFTFVIHSNSDSIVGGDGGKLGYQGIPSSVAVKFDLYNNSGEGTDSTGLYTDGAYPTVPAADMTSSGVNLHSGDPMAVQLVYNGTTLTMTITDTVTSASFSTDWTINIPAMVGADTAYVGFTGSTGGLTAIQKILGWTYSTSSGSNPSPSLPMPTFSVAGGTYRSPLTVSISDATPGTTIYYTYSGRTPTTSSTQYTTPITVSSTATLEAIAVESGYTSSPAATATYTINSASSTLPAPTFSVAAGTYSSAQKVAISDATSGTTIYYTTNGTTPTTSSTVYSGSLTVSSSQILEAIAVESGYTNSAVAVATYTIDPPGSTSPVINCPSGFASTGPCGVSLIGQGGQPLAVVGTTSGSTPALSGTHVNLMNANTTHGALSLNYQTQVDAQAFTAAFTFVPNGWNIAFVLNNSNNNPYFNGQDFSAGAGCEAGFFQGFSQAAPPNNVFALELDSYSPLTASGSFAYSSAQIYTSEQSPCLPNLGGTDFTYTPLTKISTSPVNLTTGSPNTTTGDTYSATIAYNGSTLTLNLFDITKGGSCPGSSCFTHTWTDVNIPSYVGGNTAWVGLTTATNQPVNSPLYVNSFVYDVSQ